MKGIFLRSALLVAMVLASTRAAAYDFTVDGIYYNVVSLSDLTCSVTSGDEKYTGDVVIPDQVVYNNRTLTVVGISKRAFIKCTYLTSVIIGNSVTTIGNDAFSGCTGLTSVTIPNSVTTIDNFAFKECTALKELVIEDGESVLELGYNENFYGLFHDCPLESFYLGRNLSYSSSYNDGYSPFYNIKNLKEVNIGNSVTTIGDYTFNECGNLMTIYSLNTTPPSVSDGSFTNKQYLDANVYVPEGSLSAYQSADVWKDFWNLQETDGASGINSVETNTQETAPQYYDLQGRKLIKPQKGINIVNGKKILVK